MFLVFVDERVNTMWKSYNDVTKPFAKLYNNKFKIYNIKTSIFTHK